ncbi:hypothetical protein BT96DRAFT_1003945 [Gymnopus androsaceus JB14]|uniref:Uncharacterized protein n=1 Tax=Gymnopus androsaceus JB14 TaxID=1447944 RepID=A0A6A4GU77_9AGAR|nr:hypothetical protein BT96DRAFT_1003945 [Gymnopus androsaceus JB14]
MRNIRHQRPAERQAPTLFAYRFTVSHSIRAPTSLSSSRLSSSTDFFQNENRAEDLGIGKNARGVFASTPQQKIVQVLVNRLKNKASFLYKLLPFDLAQSFHQLPCNSGVPLDCVESDNATAQAVDALVNLAHEALDMIGFAVGELLEKLTQQQDSTGVVSIEVLQSQLFLLKACQLQWPNGGNRTFVLVLEPVAARRLRLMVIQLDTDQVLQIHLHQYHDQNLHPWKKPARDMFLA